MLYVPQVPLILDSFDFPKQLRVEKMTPGGFQNVMNHYHARCFFKKLVEEILLKATSPENLLEKHRKEIDAYFALQLETLGVLGGSGSFPINFEYSPFMWTKKMNLNTSSCTNEEVFTADLLMSRYMIANLYVVEANKSAVTLRAHVKKSMAKGEQDQTFYKDLLKKILLNYAEALTILKKLEVFKAEIFKSLTTLPQAFPEFQPRILDILFEMVNINANQIFMELLRMKGSFEEMTGVCKDSYERLQRVDQMIKIQPGDIVDEIRIHVDIMKEVIMAQGAYAMAKMIFNEIRLENYKRKGFKELSKDMLGLTEYLKKQCEYLSKLEGFLKAEFYEFFGEIVDGEYMPFADLVSKVHADFHKNVELPDGAVLFVGWTKTLSYLEAKEAADKHQAAKESQPKPPGA